MTSRDPLELLGDLPDWPGATPPKNRKGSASRPKVDIDRYNGAKPKKYKMGGLDLELFTVGELAKALGRKAVTLRMWENQGWIPKAKYRTPPPSGTQLPDKPTKGRRLYTVSQLELLLTAAELHKIDHPTAADWPGFKQYIKDNWPNN